MFAHGADPDAVDVETFGDICVMYNDGLIGNHSLLETLGGLTAGIYNYIRPNGAPAYKLQDIIPRAYQYIYKPLTAEELAQKTQETLKNFAFAHAPAGMFKE